MFICVQWADAYSIDVLCVLRAEIKARAPETLHILTPLTRGLLDAVFAAGARQQQLA